MLKRVGLGLVLAVIGAAVACSGDKGDAGPAGPPGAAGATGATGATGETGSNGAMGSAGEAGASGAPGATGEAGAPGANGEAGAPGATGEAGLPGASDPAATYPTATKIKHVVIVFGENISFDHYFGTYPNAANKPGEAPFFAATGTPKANDLATPLDPTNSFAAVTGVDLIASNPNSTQPFRLGPGDGFTQSQNHNYTPEQKAFDQGHMDLFPENVGVAGPPPILDGGAAAIANSTGLTMAYFDGNSVNALWDYAQNYAMNDNSWTSTFGPSTPGALNLISGQTNGIGTTNQTGSLLLSGKVIADGNGGLTMIGDTDPLGDVCSTAAYQDTMLGKNIGDLLNAKGISWGWFEGGFDLTITNPNGTTGCNRLSVPTVPNSASGAHLDYVPHHEPFQFYPSTANPKHFRPTSVTAIGHTFEDDGVTVDPANHQYDSHDFFDALKGGNFPAVSYLKAPAFQDAHADDSDPTDEQNFIVSIVTAVQQSGDWDTTAIIFAYDDSDGWYDHQAPTIVNPSSSAGNDALNGAGLCNTANAQQPGAPTRTTPLLGAVPPDGGAPAPALGRCGYGTRIPLLVVSPFAKKNFIDHTLTDQTSTLKFIEDNWLAGQRVQTGGSFDTIAGSINNMLQF
jgi:phospholipase C